MKSFLDPIALNVASTDVRPIVICSHQRSGTHLTIDLLRRHFPDCSSWKYPGQSLEWLVADLDHALRTGTEQAARRFSATLRRSRRPLIKTHLPVSTFFGISNLGAKANRSNEAAASVVPQRLLDWLREKADFCYAARDGRSVMVSYHLYRRGYDTSAMCDIGTFMRQSTESGKSRVAHWQQHVQQGLSTPQVLPVLFHKTLENPKLQIEELADFFGMRPRHRVPALPRPIQDVKEYRLARLLGVRPQSTARPGRHGRPPKWWNSFTEADNQLFANEGGAGLMLLGIEDSQEWVHDHRPDARKASEPVVPIPQEVYGALTPATSI